MTMITYSIRIQNLDWHKYQKQPLDVFCEKKYFLKIWQTSQETLMNFVKFLRTPFLQNNSRRLLLKCGHCKNEVREIDCLCCRKLDDAFCFGKIPDCEGSMPPFGFYGPLPSY